MLVLVSLVAPQIEYFINSDRSWNVERLRDWFVYVDEVDILNIMLHYRMKEDRLLWYHNLKGHYSIRSGYRVAVEQS